MAAQYDYILYDTRERVARITLNRPEKLNALSHELRGEVFHALREAEADPAIGVIILAAAGRAFSAGYDLSPTPTPSDYVEPHSRMCRTPDPRTPTTTTGRATRSWRTG